DGSGGDACLYQGQYATVNDTASNNHVALSDGNTVGVLQQGGLLSNLMWSGNVYAAPDCDATTWVWWDGSSQDSNTLSFGGWQGAGQDTSGSCGPPSSS